LKKKVTLPNGSMIEVGLVGNPKDGVVMLPGTKPAVYGEEADMLRLWGVDPELGEKLVQGLSDGFCVLYFDYEGHYMAQPEPDRFTPEHISNDMLRIADQMQVDRFWYYGYSWLALAGLQLSIRTDRLNGLIMGGFPPYGGPYKEMLTVTTKTYEQALSNQNKEGAGEETGEQDKKLVEPEDIDWNEVEVSIHPDQCKQFMTMYKHLADFDDRIIHPISSMPKLAFAGELDLIEYGESFGNVRVDIADRLKRHRDELEAYGWDVEIVKGERMDHTGAMQPAVVLPLLKRWLAKRT